MAAPSAFSDRVENFCRRLTDRRIDGSLAAAKGTAELLRQLVTSSRLNTPEVMLAEVKRVGLRIQAAKPIGGCRRRGRTSDQRRQPRQSGLVLQALSSSTCAVLVVQD